jgi:hypothetical protein
VCPGGGRGGRISRGRRDGAPPVSEDGCCSHTTQPQHDSGGESLCAIETPHRCHVGIIQTTQVKG